ncbi:TPA: MFS transporter [Kluyvera ascorbata]|uniref:MFS transporter n=1 Tax=Kluyvera genomosp. 2 TaxID=2774054 RepID=A0A2T2Y0K4_9ENTR|nr:MULTISPECIES: MFS transporter [Enterobacteriaceae]HAT3919301.1 MFS transporter [Kluyvera ascorbata]PSR46065.1 MFS transporter [Kluyvera genomosp. 2]BBQ85129.1 MFS transporter [Klebsiella sp. WP3-W18-ESBL-02]BBR22181.1 MFS transporter [Klebsiella sp. WP3-S18-ESBL-05]HAT3921460.1 MFS transporter [Kluyvera ascorbata]
MKSQSQMIFLLFIGYVFVYIDKTVTGFALLPIEKEFGLNAEQLGYITGIFFLAYSLFQVPAGWLNDRIGYKTMLVLSLSALGIFALCFGALGASFGLLLLFRFLAGVGHSGYPCSCAKAVVSNFSVEKRTFAQSILLSSAGLAMTIGPIIAVNALALMGWHMSFTVLGVIVCVIAALIALRVPRQQVTVGVQKSAISGAALWRNPTVILLFLSIFCVNIPSYGLMAWLPKFFVQHMGMSLSASGYVVAAGGLGIWISSLGTGWLVGKYFLNREPLVIAISALLSAVAIFAIFHATTPLTASLLLFVGEVFLMATFVTAFTLPMKRLPENMMGSAIGLINTGGTLGGFVSPIVIGYLVQSTNGYASAFVFLSLAMVCSAIAVLPLMKRRATASLPVTD